MRFLVIALLAAIVSAVYSQKGERDMRIVTSYINSLSGIWEMRDTLVTDSGTWTLTCELRLRKDSSCYYSSDYSFVTTDQHYHRSYANAGFWGEKWDIGNWKYSSSYNMLYMYASGGEIESWRILNHVKDTMITRPTGQLLLEMLDWPFGQRKEIKWIKTNKQ